MLLRAQTRCQPTSLPWQHALKDHWLIDHVGAPEVADRDDQTRPTVAIAKIELARIRPSAAVPSFGMCPEPAPIKADDLIEWARYHDHHLPSGKGCGQPPCGPRQFRFEDNVSNSKLNL
jgi:hypothetical protein